jgi:hypothetical protein
MLRSVVRFHLAPPIALLRGGAEASDIDDTSVFDGEDLPARRGAVKFVGPSLRLTVPAPDGRNATPQQGE